MKTNRVKELWKQGKPAVQGWCATGNPYIAELMAHAGFDAVVIDWQHGVGVSQESVVACIQAMGSSDAVPIVRLPRNTPDYISYVLDAGAYGVIVPMVNTYEAAEAAGRACRYAPRGSRSVAGNRATLQEPLDDYIKRSNEDVICLVMVETVQALNNLAVAYGKVGQPTEALPLMEKALELGEKILGPDHPSTVTRMFNLARIYRDLGQPDRAHALLEKSL